MSDIFGAVIGMVVGLALSAPISFWLAKRRFR